MGASLEGTIPTEMFVADIVELSAYPSFTTIEIVSVFELPPEFDATMS